MSFPHILVAQLEAATKSKSLPVEKRHRIRAATHEEDMMD